MRTRISPWIRHARWGLRPLPGFLLALILVSGTGGDRVHAADERRAATDVSSVGDAADLTVFGQVGGMSSGLEVVGGYAYVGVGMRVVVFDISQPSSPKLVGRSPILPSTVRAIQVQAGMAYVVCGDRGFQVIDVSTPTTPRLVGSLDIEGFSGDVSVEGNMAFVVQIQVGTRPTASLLVLDVTVPARPLLIGNLYLPGGATKVEASGGMVYVADGWWNGGLWGLTVVNVTDPRAPHLAGSLRMSPFEDLEVVEHLAVSVADLELSVLDLSAPESPRMVSRLALPSRATAVDVQGRLAYVAGGILGLLVVDIAAPSAPSIIGSADFGSADFRGAMGYVDVSGPLAFVVGDGRGLMVFDLAVPSAPRRIAAADLSGPAYALQIVDKLAYVSRGYDLQVIDVSAPEEPLQVGRVPVRGANNVRVSGGLAYVCMMNQGRLSVIDVNTPSLPNVVGSIDGLSMPLSVDVAGSLAYVADGPVGLKVVDVSTPSAPRIIGGIDLVDDMVTDVDVSGGQAYMATRKGLTVVDISEPRSPHVVSTVELAPNGEAYTLRVVGNVAYVGMLLVEEATRSARGGLFVVDVAVPSSPRTVGRFDLNSTIPFHIDVADKLVYVGDRDSGLSVVDATVPGAMQMVGSFAGVEAWDEDVVDGLVYVAGGVGGLVVLGVGDDPTGAGHVAWLPFLAAAQPLR